MITEIRRMVWGAITARSHLGGVPSPLDPRPEGEAYYGFARAVDSPRWKGPENFVRPKEVLKNMRPVDMTPEEREAVEKEAEEVWTWIASLAIAAGIMFLIRYFFLQAFTANRR